MKNSPREKVLARLDRVGHLLDSSLPIGDSGYRVGLDPISGLLPGIGDALSTFLGGYILLEAARLGASRFTLGRMMLNLGFDALVGAVPFVGDLFDFAFKANERNLRLVREARLANDNNPYQKLSSAFIWTLLLIVLFVSALSALVIVAGLKGVAWNFIPLALFTNHFEDTL